MFGKGGRVSKEKLRKCERFEELRAGMLVVLRDCKWGCPRPHRVLLIDYAHAVDTENPVDGITIGRGWEALPAPSAPHASRSRFWVTERPVQEGRVYIVETGVDKETTRETARELVKAR